MQNVLGWLIVGALIGWLGSIGLHPRRSRQLNLVAATIGAVLGGMWFSWASLDTLISGSAVSFSGLFIACIGAISLLTISSVAQHGRDPAPATMKVRPTADGAAPPVAPHRQA
jgi:uncharacterized membrane protein YeaQ/YmgE (transglycosylase-associated protein family)